MLMAISKLKGISIKGFTLLEYMMAIFVFGILVSMAVPAMRFYVQNQRALSISTILTSALSYTRSEALKRGTPVSICSASDTTLTACSGANDWVNGWIIFNDPNGDGVIANANDRLRVHEGFTDGAVFNANVPRLTYAGTGFLASNPGVFNISAADCTGDNGRVISVTATGRLEVDNANC